MTGWGVATMIFSLILIIGPILTFGLYLKEVKSIIREGHK
jgi:hypothetical protein